LQRLPKGNIKSKTFFVDQIKAFFIKLSPPFPSYIESTKTDGNLIAIILIGVYEKIARLENMMTW
jgi:hypothetical protein